jgi:Tfp pilus assembly protein PilF
MTGRDIHQQGLQFFHENQYENAAKWLREALTLDPTAERWSDWASAELACGRTEQAEAGYRQALKLDLDNGEAALNLGALYATSGRAAEALGWLERGMLAANETQQKLACKLQEQCRSMLATTRAAPAKPSALTEFCRAIQVDPTTVGQTNRAANTIDLGKDLFLKQAQEGRFLLPKNDTGVSQALMRPGAGGSGTWRCSSASSSQDRQLSTPGPTSVITAWFFQKR